MIPLVLRKLATASQFDFALSLESAYEWGDRKPSGPAIDDTSDSSTCRYIAKTFRLLSIQLLYEVGDVIQAVVCSIFDIANFIEQVSPVERMSDFEKVVLVEL